MATFVAEKTFSIFEFLRKSDSLVYSDQFHLVLPSHMNKDDKRIRPNKKCHPKTDSKKELPFDRAQFKSTWRSYQQRVLDEIDHHLSDNHLHVVAPPGSGKTVLGLEIICRINRAALVLTPTLAIRDQWILRFRDLFFDAEDKSLSTSTDIGNPRNLTVMTYQGLHSAVKSDRETVLKGLKNAQVEILVVDEAHHLTKSWWETLTFLKEELRPIIVGLTATPPYDVSWEEWCRYEALNGEVDAEITVPELIAAGDLCPHQDFVIFSRPSKSELKVIRDLNSRKIKTIDEILNDTDLISALSSHPFFTEPEAQTISLYEQIDFYIALLIILNHLGFKVEKAHKKIVGNPKAKIPILTEVHIAFLFDYLLFSQDSHFESKKPARDRWLVTLKRRGFLSGKSVQWSKNHITLKHLTRSVNKIDSIERIVDFELEQLQDKLHMVIITDYIRKEVLQLKEDDTQKFGKLGAVPIFERLRKNLKGNHSIGLLTGSLVVIPRTLVSSEDSTFQKKPYDLDNRFVIISNPKSNADLISWTTKRFEDGEIQVLIGTNALLGEGWDAPSINSLILASFVGAHVSTNQMRGRAMRTQPGNPNKTANIWHLACLDPIDENGGSDIQNLVRRFSTFVGISYSSKCAIHSGFNRVTENQEWVRFEINQANDSAYNKAMQRRKMADRWIEALSGGKQLVEQITKPYPLPGAFQRQKSLYFNRTLGYFLLEALLACVEFFWDFIKDFIEELLDYESPQDLENFLRITIVMFMFTIAPKFLKYLLLSIKHRDISKDLLPIGLSILEALVRKGDIRTPLEELSIRHESDTWGAATIYLDGSTRSESSIFLDSLQETLDPIRNPRYILSRENFLGSWIRQKDYHSVPEILGKNKELANYLHDSWKKNLGRGELIFARTRQGRQQLLKARYNAFSGQFVARLERSNIWC